MYVCMCVCMYVCTSKTSTWPQVCVCVWNGAGRPLKVLKHAKIKHAEARGKKKHAGRTAALHANDQT